MARPVTLFTGQFADLPLAELAPKAKACGYDGLELACWGDHFEVDKALENDSYLRQKRELLDQHGLQCFAIGAHLVGQAVCDPIDERHRGILPPDVWGDGDPEGVRQRAAERMKDTARAAARAVSITFCAARSRTPSGSPSPQTSGGRIASWRASIGSHTACPTRCVEIAQHLRLCRWRMSQRERQ